MKLHILLAFLTLSVSAFSKGNSTFQQDSVKEKMPVVHYEFKAKQLILPASLLATGFITNAIGGEMKDFHLLNRKDKVKQIRIDDYMEWGMFGLVFVNDLIGEEKHNWVDQAFLLILAEGFNAGMIHGLKNTMKETRPDGRPYAFPSGHTANAFLGAHLNYKEFKDSSPVQAYSGYALAAFVGGLRMYNNRHWVCDVVAGAGVGILSVELSYLTYFPIRNAIAKAVNKKANNNLVLIPTLHQNGGGVYLSFNF